LYRLYILIANFRLFPRAIFISLSNIQKKKEKANENFY
jgi:hypothetical protein